IRHTRFSRDWSSDVCSSDLESIPEGDLVLAETFDEDDSWETGSYEKGELRLEDGQYIVSAFESGSLFWGQNTDLHEDVVIQVTKIGRASCREECTSRGYL